jgi:hypothetical protein
MAMSKTTTTAAAGVHEMVALTRSEVVEIVTLLTAQLAGESAVNRACGQCPIIIVRDDEGRGLRRMTLVVESEPK